MDYIIKYIDTTWLKSKSFLLAISFLCLCSANGIAQKKTAPIWPVEKGPIRVIIDSDAGNEVDDQWAIALALGFPETFKIEGFVAAHYGTRGGVNGIQKSYKNILEVLDSAGMKGKYPVFKGSDPIAYLDSPPASQGVDFIIKTARTANKPHPLYLISLGAATDIACAILKDPSIQDKIVIFWHGRTEWPERCWNFNASNDLKAVQVVFNKQVPFVLFDTGTFLNMPMYESATRISVNGVLGNYLHNIRKRSAYAQLPDKGFFDVGDIAVLIDDHLIKWEIINVPAVGDDYKYIFENDKGKFVRKYEIDREPVFKLLDVALTRIQQWRVGCQSLKSAEKKQNY